MDSANSMLRVQAMERHRLQGYLGLVGVDLDGMVHFVSPQLEGYFDVSAADFIGKSFLEFVAEDDVEQAIESFVSVAERNGHHQAREIRLKLNGAITRVDTVADNRLDDPDVELVLVNIGDPDDRRRSAQLLDAQAEAVRQIALGGSLSAAMSEILAFVEHAMPGFRAAAYFDDPRWDDDAVASPTLSADFTRRIAAANRLNPALPGALAIAGEEIIVAGDLSEPRWAEAAIVVAGAASSIWSVPVRYERGAPCVGLIEFYGPSPAHPQGEDWTILDLVSRLSAVAYDRVRTQERLVLEAEIDPLTGVPNRRVLKSMISSLLAGSERGHAVLFVDLDRLKIVNDGMGHEAGDQVIREAARRLVAAVGDDGVVGRFGGDEFVVIAQDVAIDRRELAERCIAAFADPVSVAGRELYQSASIGVTVVADQRSANEVMSDADTAMYDAKRAGRNRWQMYDAAARHSAARRLRLEEKLRTAIEQRSISATYQPVVSTDGWKLCGLEVLARWEAEPGHWISPVEFIPLAEEMGLIDELSAHMVDLAEDAVDMLWSVHRDACHVSVNISPVQLESERFVERIARASSRGQPGTLCLEMTEQHMMDRGEQTLGHLQHLVDYGVGLAVDDFGIGYSSLGALHRLPAETLKIDRHLIRQVGEPAGDAVVAAVVGIADAYGMTTVAEGVETAVQAVRLRELGVDRLQGYLFARPEPLIQIVRRLARPGWYWDVPERSVRV